jgi:uncharacterized protein (TIGR02996 family)
LTRLAELLEAVYADPEDLSCRLVYADALSDADDPRGEFITLQCLGDGSACSDRELELLAAHGAAWLGRLAPIVDPTHTVFAQGFVSAVRVKKVPRPKLLALAGDPIWATVTRIDFDDDVGGIAMKNGAVVRGPRVPAASIVLAPVMRSLREVNGIDGDVLLTLCRDGDALPIRSLGARTYPLLDRGTDDVWRIADGPRIEIENARGLPQLRRLALHGYPCDRPDLRWLLRSPLAGRLEQLELDNFGGELDHWIVMTRAANPALGELVVSYWSDRAVMKFRAGSNGPLSKIEVDTRQLTEFQRRGIETALARVPDLMRRNVDVIR